MVIIGVTQAAAEKAHKELKQLAKERDELAQSVHSMESSHRATQKTLSAAEQSARQELQMKTEELQVALLCPTTSAPIGGIWHRVLFSLCACGNHGNHRYLMVDAGRH